MRVDGVAWKAKGLSVGTVARTAMAVAVTFAVATAMALALGA